MRHRQRGMTNYEDEYETYEERHKLPSGEEVVAFGYYGHD